MSSLLRDYEDIQWFIFRYSSLKSMPASELGTHYLGGADKTFFEHALRLCVKASAGIVSDKSYVANVAFPLLLNRGGEGMMHGPRMFESLPDTGLNRAKLYVSLVAHLAGFDREKDKAKLWLWLPPTLSEHNELREKLHKLNKNKYPFRPTPAGDFDPLQTTPTRLQVEYNYKFIDDWLAYAKRHSDYCMSSEWEYRVIDYSK